MTFFDDPNAWLVAGLLFLLGLLIGAWMTGGGRRKWKSRHNDEVTARKALEAKDKEREAHWATREKEWRETDSRRDAALRDRPAVAAPTRDDRGSYEDDRLRDRHPDDRRPDDRPMMDRDQRDLDRDGVPDNRDRRPLDDDRR